MAIANITNNILSDSGVATSSLLTTNAAASTYLPLAGGTLTGNLNGTTASFENGVNLARTSGNVGIGIDAGSEKLEVFSGSSRLVQKFRTSTNGLTTTYASANATVGFIGNGLGLFSTATETQFGIRSESDLLLGAGGGVRLTIAAAGAATFSSSVSLGTNANSGDTASLNIKQAGTSYNQGIYIERGGERNGYHMYIGGALDSLTFRRNYFGTQSDVMSLTRDGNVGIGTASPSYKLHLVGGSEVGSRFIVSGTYAPIQFSGDGGTTIGGINAYANNVYFGRGTATGVQSDLLITSSDGLVVMVTGGGFANQTTLDANTRFQGPNNSATAAKCYAWNTYSDQRIKEDVNPLNYGLNEIMQLNPVSYNQHDSEVIDGEIILKETYKPTIGLIAQEVYDLIPESVGVGNDTELWGLDYDKIVPVLIKAIQEQQIQIDSLKNQMQ